MLEEKFPWIPQSYWIKNLLDFRREKHAHISLRIVPEEFQIHLVSDWSTVWTGGVQDSAQDWQSEGLLF